MEVRYTKYQVPRGTRPDAETFDKLYLIKNVSSLRATYQIKLQTYLAQEKGKKLIIRVPKHCVIEPSLKSFITSNQKTIRIERV